MISLLNLVKQSSQKARLRKMCRNLREIFQLLGLKLETETENGLIFFLRSIKHDFR